MERQQPSLEELISKRELNSLVLLRRAENTDDIAVKSEIYEYVYKQETTHIAEVLDGVVKSDVTCELKDGRLYALDENGPVDWEQFHLNNLDYAYALIESDPNLTRYLDIAKAEHEEGILQSQLVQQGEPATMVVLSPCGDDLFSKESLKKIGRDPEKSRAMLRLSVFDGQKLTIQARSMDNMTLDDAKFFLKENFDTDFDWDADSVDVLKTRIVKYGAHFDLADQLQTSQAGIDTQAFVESQHDLIANYLSAIKEVALRDLNLADQIENIKKLRYDHMSAFSYRLQGQNISADAFAVARAGNQARDEGKEYYGCEMRVTSNVNRLGYGAKGEMNSRCITCPNCSKVVDLPRELFSLGVMHCVECKATATRDGKKMSGKARKILEKMYSKNKSKPEGNESFYEWWMKFKNRSKTKQNQKPAP